MEYLVRFFAPRGPVDFCAKVLIALLTLGLINHVRDVLQAEGAADTYFNNLLDAVVVGLPFVVLAFALIGHLRRLQLRLAELAATDMLTGLPNRRAFIEAAVSTPPDKKCDALLMIDVDHFKRVNDTYGHAVGDLCLQHLARILRERVRSVDIVGRMGGEEFAALLRNVTPEEARAIADRIAEGTEVEVGEGSEKIGITASVGLAPYCAKDEIDQSLRNADAALYYAKSAGRARSWGNLDMHSPVLPVPA